MVIGVSPGKRNRPTEPAWKDSRLVRLADMLSVLVSIRKRQPAYDDGPNFRLKSC